MEDYMEKCPECESADIIENDGEVVCRRCGLVLGVVVDRTAEWRSFTLEEKLKRSRVGMPEMMVSHDKGLTTIIGDVNLDGRGRKIPIRLKLKALRLRKWQRMSSVHSSEERNLVRALKEISNLANILNLPSSVSEEASIIYRRVMKMGLARGREIIVLAAASVYAACRIFGVPRSLRNVARSSGLHVKEVARAYRIIINHLDINVPVEEPKTYIKLITSKLNLPTEVEAEAVKILGSVKENGNFVGDPRGIAAGAIYIAAKRLNINVTQRELAAASGVTEVTVRNRFKKIERWLKKKVF